MLGIVRQTRTNTYLCNVSLPETCECSLLSRCLQTYRCARLYMIVDEQRGREEGVVVRTAKGGTRTCVRRLGFCES